VIPRQCYLPVVSIERLLFLIVDKIGERPIHQNRLPIPKLRKSLCVAGDRLAVHVGVDPELLDIEEWRDPELLPMATAIGVDGTLSYHAALFGLLLRRNAS
jgi:hypothetical protein